MDEIDDGFRMKFGLGMIWGIALKRGMHGQWMSACIAICAGYLAARLGLVRVRMYLGVGIAICLVKNVPNVHAETSLNQSQVIKNQKTDIRGQDPVIANFIWRQYTGEIRQSQLLSYLETSSQLNLRDALQDLISFEMLALKAKHKGLDLSEAAQLALKKTSINRYLSDEIQFL